MQAALEQLSLAARQDQPQQQHDHQQQQHGQQQQQQQPDKPAETPEALHNPACLAATFSWLDGEASLLQCSRVCRLWHSVLEADDIWRRVYLRRLPRPEPHESAGSYRQAFRRLRGLLGPPAPVATALKGSALCYNAATGHLVSFNARQRILSVQLPDGSIRSEVAEVEGAAGSAHRPLLASTGSELVVLAAADGALQLWDARACQARGVLGRHASFVTSLAASGHLVASTCSGEMRLWDVERRACLFEVPVGLPLPSPVLEPHVAVCHQQQLLALANCAAPAPSSVVKVYYTTPASRSGNGAAAAAGNSSSSSSAAGASRSAAAAAAVATVGSSSCPDARGALLLRELPVNAAADMKLAQGLLLVASCFHGRAVSSNSPYKSERPFTVVVHVWETRSWQLTRLISPRMWTDSPIFSMQGTPLIALSQGVLLCATLRSGSTNAFPSCCVHALQLPAPLARAGEAVGGGNEGDDGGGSGGHARRGLADLGQLDGSPTRSGLTLLSVSPSKRGAGSGASGPRVQPEPIGTGAAAQGRVAVATAGGAGTVGVSASNTIMLAVSDQERQGWRGRVPLVEDTNGRLTVLLTTPTRLAMATEAGQVLSCQLLPAAPDAGGAGGADVGAAGPSGGAQPGAAAAPAAGSPSRAAGAGAPGAAQSPQGPVVHVVQPHATGDRYIHLDL